MTTEQVIIAYIKNITKGFVKLDLKCAKALKEIILANEKVISVNIEKRRFDGNNNRYDLVQTLQVNKELAIDLINKYKTIPQYKGFYRYSCSELEFEYYTVNCNLFEK